MRAAGWLLTAGLAWIAGADGREEPELPDWTEGDVEMLDSGMLVPGSVLLGTGIVNPETGHSDVVAAVPAPDPEDVIEEPEPPPGEIPAEFLTDYFAAKPGAMLVDPQKLLSQQEYIDQLAFLHHHANDSEIDIFFYLFDAGQEIPADVDAGELVGRFFSLGRPAVVVFYFVGAPQRSMIMLGPQLGELVSDAEQRRMLGSSVTKALDKANPVDQLEGFAVQLAIRLYWVEKAFAGNRVTDKPLVELAEKPRPGPAHGRMPGLLEIARPWLWPAGGGLAGLAVACIGWQLFRRRQSFRLPEFEVAPRLGGEHGAGIGAVVTFGNPSLPPSIQRDQMPDYLRRM